MKQQRIKLMTLLTTLDTADRKQFMKYLQADFVNANQQVIDLFEFLSKQVRKLDKEAIKAFKIPEVKAFNLLYPKEKFIANKKQKNKFNKVKSRLKEHLEDFLVIAELQNKQNDKYLLTRSILLTNKLAANNLNETATKYLYNTLDFYEQNSQVDVDFFEVKYQLHELLFRLNLVMRNATDYTKHLQELLDHFNYFYLLSMLRYLCSTDTLEKLNPHTFTHQIPPKVLLQFIENSPNLLEIPVIAGYYYYYAFLSTGDPIYFTKIKKLLMEKHKALDPFDLRQLSSGATNLGSSNILNTDFDVAKELYEIYAFVLPARILHVDGQLSPIHFQKSIRMALDTGHDEWAWETLQNYQNDLSEAHQSYFVAFCTAEYYFYQGDYNKVYEYLQQIEKKDHYLEYAWKILYIKTAYEEAKDWEEYISSFINNLKRKLQYDDAKGKTYLGYGQPMLVFVNLIGELYEWKVKAMNRPNKERLEAMKQICLKEIVYEKEWLLEKIEMAVK